MDGSLQGRLLVATPKLTDPNFDRTVVFLCIHDENGSLGLVLNRPLEGADVEEHLPQWSPHVTRPAVIFLGGPVQTSVALGLARGGRPALADSWTPVGQSVGLLNLGASPDEVSGIEDLRIFLGYAGWGAGQLDQEIAEGAWVVVETDAGDLFTTEPGGLWRGVLRRQRGDLALLAFAPRDASLN